MKLSPEAKTKIDAVLKDVANKQNGVPGVVYSAVDKNGNVLYEGAAGVRSLGEPDVKMTTDTVCYIASCTKLITTIACLQLMEQKKVQLDDPQVIERILPELSQVKIVTGSKGNFKYTTPKNAITLRMLLDHSSGFSYTFFNPLVRDVVEEKTGQDDEFAGTTAPYLVQPLITEPGTEWNYSIGLDWAGLLVERVEKMSLGEYFQKNIFDPIGVKDIQFGGQRPNLQSRFAGMHQRNDVGELNSRDHFPCATKASFHSGGAGLCSTASDYLKILTCLLNEGIAYNGAKILEPSTVSMMFNDSLKPDISTHLDRQIDSARPALSNTIPNMQPNCKKGWGLSFLLTQDELPTGRSKNSAWWAGIANCYYVVDRTKGVATIILSQILPFADPTVMGAWFAAEGELYKGITV